MSDRGLPEAKGGEGAGAGEGSGAGGGLRAGEGSDFAAAVGRKATRKGRAQRAGDQGVWFGLGMSGLIGWSVAVPTLLGAMLGVWLDRTHARSFSWTLTLLFAGLVLGCFNAWHWVSQQNEAMRERPEETDD